MEINIIAAVARNGAIGFRGRLIYWLPDDMRRFRALTTGHTIVMGHRTFLSLPKGALPNRRNIVLSRSLLTLPGCEVYPSWEEAIEHCGEEETVYVIGGASVYEQAMSCATRLCLTEVDDTPTDADAFFPSYDGWREVSSEQHRRDERHDYNFRFVDYVPGEPADSPSL